MRARPLGSALAFPVAGASGGRGAYGRAVPDCATLAATGRITPRDASMQGGGDVAVQKDLMRGGLFNELPRDRPQVEHVRRRRFPYPARPGDSVFSGGAGYIIKNEIQVAIACAF